MGSTSPHKMLGAPLRDILLLSCLLGVSSAWAPLPGVMPLKSRASACLQVQMQGTDTLRRQEGPVERVLHVVDSFIDGAKSLIDHKLMKRKKPAKEASMADQYMGFYSPKVTPERDPIWRRGASPLISFRDRATADLSDTYESVSVKPTTLAQALKLSSEIPEDEAMDMQGWPDSFM